MTYCKSSMWFSHPRGYIRLARFSCSLPEGSHSTEAAACSLPGGRTSLSLVLPRLQKDKFPNWHTVRENREPSVPTFSFRAHT